jgi:hypothetical protein
MSKTVTRPHLCLCHSVKNLPAKQLRIIRAIAPATGEKETPNPAPLAITVGYHRWLLPHLTLVAGGTRERPPANERITFSPI